MTTLAQHATSIDPIWSELCKDAQRIQREEPIMTSLMQVGVLNQKSFERALSHRIASKLSENELSFSFIRDVIGDSYSSDPKIPSAARADISATYERDPACHSYTQPLFFFKGYQAVQAYRTAHWLWQNGRKDLAYFFQSKISEVFGVDIHPGARLGKGIMIDHAHSIVIGETAIVGDNVSMLHSVTLGGTGKADGDRHPKIESGVLIGAGAKVLGNIRIGHCTRIAAGSVVLDDVPPCKTVAGVPAKIVGEAGCDQPAVNMDQRFKLS